MNRFRAFAYKVSKNHTRTCWVLKCDIRKFFASIDQAILLNIVAAYIPGARINALLAEVVGSFHSDIIVANAAASATMITPKGLPLGNLTSQLLVSVYMNEFDQFVKHELKAKYYVRYADDFVFLSEDKEQLEQFMRPISAFLYDRLKLALHPTKVHLSTFASGVDFLGWLHFSDHWVLRTSTKRRMWKRVAGLDVEHLSVQSYLGLLKHGNATKLERTIAGA